MPADLLAETEKLVSYLVKSYDYAKGLKPKPTTRKPPANSSSREPMLPTRRPRADFDSRYSDPQASATDWQGAREVLATTELVVAHHGPARWTSAQYAVDHCLVRRRCPLLYRTGGT